MSGEKAKRSREAYGSGSEFIFIYSHCRNVKYIQKGDIMKAIMVFHGNKVEGLGLNPVEIKANPPMTLDGMAKILDLVPEVQGMNPGRIYCSRMARALNTASVFSLELDLDIQTKSKLGQHGNRDGQEDIFYPGHEGEDLVKFQADGVEALREIYNEIPEKDATVLVVSHRPTICGVVAHTADVHDNRGISSFLKDPQYTDKGYVVLEINKGTMKLL